MRNTGRVFVLVLAGCQEVFWAISGAQAQREDSIIERDRGARGASNISEPERSLVRSEAPVQRAIVAIRKCTILRQLMKNHPGFSLRIKALGRVVFRLDNRTPLPYGIPVFAHGPMILILVQPACFLFGLNRVPAGE